MSAGIWLAGKELRARRLGTALAVAAVAAAVALGTGLELVARAREEATALRIDAMGAPLRIVPAGVDGSSLARLELGGAVLPEGSGARAAAALGLDLRELRARLVLREVLGGRPTPVVGTSSSPEGAVELGAALAERLGGPASVRLSAVELPVTGVRAPTGSSEDGALFLSLPAAQRLAGAAAVNELHLFLRAGTRPEEATARLEQAGLTARVVPSGRGATADGEIHGALARARRLAQAVLAVMVGLGLAVAARLDAAERRVEVATLVAIGAGWRSVSLTLLARSVVVGAVGGLLGGLAGAAVAALQDPEVAQGLLRAWTIVALAPAAGAALGSAAAAPTALASALRDPVPVLQES